MPDSTFSPRWSSPPGETIKDILSEKNIPQEFFANQIQIPLNSLNDLFYGAIKINTEIAHKLEITIGGSSDFWLNRESQYRSDLSRLAITQRTSWIGELPLKDMIAFGWIKNSLNIEKECLDFFNVKDIVSWKTKYSDYLQSVSFRKTSAFESKDVAVLAWIRRGEILSERIECKPWNPTLFEKTLEDIKPLTRKKDPKEFLPALINACAKCGVSIAIVRTPTGCRASGATKFITDERALMLLSFRYLSDDQFWFTFYHEAGHLLLHGSEKVILEGVYEDSKLEQEANLFAGEILIPHQLQNQLQKLRGNKRDIIRFAIEANVSPGIVVGQMQHHGYIDKKYLNSFKRRYSWDYLNELMN